MASKIISMMLTLYVNITIVVGMYFVLVGIIIAIYNINWYLLRTKEGWDTIKKAIKDYNDRQVYIPKVKEW